MTASELRRLLSFLVAAYPRAEVTDATVRAYEVMLRDLDFEAAQRAAVSHVATSRFWPTVAELRELVAEEVAGAPELDQAWSEVQSAIRQHGVAGATEVEWSHELIGAAVSSLGWRELCTSTNPTTDRAHFRDYYWAARARELRAVNLAALLEAGPALLEPPPGPRQLKWGGSAKPSPGTSIITDIGRGQQ